MTTQDLVLNDYQGRLVSWHLGLWERQDYLYPLPAVWLTKGLEKPRISLEEDVPIIKNQNNGQVYKLKPGGGRWGGSIMEQNVLQSITIHRYTSASETKL